MSKIEPEDQFISDDELRSVLERWKAPEASESLDQRVVNSYYRETRGLDPAKDSISLAQPKKEVVTMKFCSTCRDEYADKFSFCPVDGTPLNGHVPQQEESTVTAVQPEIKAVAAKPLVNDIKQSIHTEPATRTEPVTHTEPATKPAPGKRSDSILSVVPRTEFSYSRAASSQHSDHVMVGEYHLTMLEDKGLAVRLADELKAVAHEYELTWPEFKRDPFGFTKRMIVGYGQMARKFLANRNVLVAMGTALVAMLALVAAVIYLDRSASGGTSRVGIVIFSIAACGVLVAIFATWMGKDRGVAVAGAQPSDSKNVLVAMMVAFVFIFALLGSVVLLDRKQEQLLAQNAAEEERVDQIIDIPDEQPTPDPGTAGFNKGSGGGSKPKQEKAGGGGGGGRQEQTPASAGKLPQASLTVPQILPPDPKPPVIKNPSLPVAATVVADPLLVPPDASVRPYGDPKSTSTVASSGPGTGNGIGNGTGTGVGPGEGAGIGPGRGGNIGGGDRNDGGGGPGGGGGGTDYNKIFSGRDVTTKARVLSKPEPQYTEEARKNQITGTVVLRAVFSSSGQVTQIRTVSGLSYGLTERAMAAARQIKFVPATKDGRPVSMWMELQYNFNLY